MPAFVPSILRVTVSEAALLWASAAEDGATAGAELTGALDAAAEDTAETADEVAVCDIVLTTYFGALAQPVTVKIVRMANKTDKLNFFIIPPIKIK